MLNFFQPPSVHAQTNLVYNGDFELYDTCPVSVSTPSSYQLNTCIGWYSPTYATSDYFNTCAPWPVSVPINIQGIRTPYSGNAYCGVLVEKGGLPLTTYGWWVEYVQSQLINSLKPMYEYEFTCYVSFSKMASEYSYWKFGAHFSPFPITKADAKPFINVAPQALNTSGNYLNDTVNWVEIKQKFIATGGEKFVTIGFFIDTMDVDTLRFNQNWQIDPNNHTTYYYIDNCSLLEIGPFEQPNVFSPNGDGINDLWKPKNRNDNDIVKIYDRWGLLVSELTAKDQGWDGRTTSGSECNAGTYYFVILNNSKKESNTQKGFIQLVR